MMALRTLESACHEVFRGWDRIDVMTSAMEDGYYVRLYLSHRRLEAARSDRNALVGKLFNQGRLEDLARVIERNQRMQGLRRYGRARR
jgi:hypothetical protein